MIKAKSIAKYAIWKWLLQQNFGIECFTLVMDGNEGTLKDKLGETMVLVYDPSSKSVYVKE